MRVSVFFLGLVVGCGSMAGQARRVGGALKVPVGIAPVAGNGTIPAGTVAALQGLASRATVIFAGHVVAVEPFYGQDAAGYVDVTFAIDQAVRGCSEGGRYVLREWAGLWSGEPVRYRVGARLLMLLPARGASGMSEPVGGMAGAIPLVATRTPPLTHGTGEAPADTGAGDGLGLSVDLRWVQALAVRGVVAAAGHARAELVLQEVGGDWAGPVAAMPPLGTGALGPGLSAVLGLLGAGHGK